MSDPMYFQWPQTLHLGRNVQQFLFLKKRMISFKFLGIGGELMRPSIINTGYKPTENLQIQPNKHNLNKQR